MHFQKRQNDLCSSPRQTIQYHGNWEESQTSIESSRKKIKLCLYYCSLSCVQLFVTSWTVTYQASPSMGFSSNSTGVGCHLLLQGFFLTQDQTQIFQIIGRLFSI